MPSHLLNQFLPTAGDPLDQLVALSNLVGQDVRLVQPGGGNSSVKLRVQDALGRETDALLVKGSGTDLRTIGRAGFCRLSLDALAGLQSQDQMSDAEMMRFMAACMLHRDDPVPSVETPLHSLLPHRVIIHTHDVATMSLTNLADPVAERVVAEAFEGRIAYVPYARPGFPLARLVAGIRDRIPAGAIGCTLAHHGLVVWGEDAAACLERIRSVMLQAEAYLAARRRGALLGSARAPVPPPDERRRRAELVLPVIRGALSAVHPVILHLDEGEDIAARLAMSRMPELAGRGMATPEHVLRAGRLPVWLELDWSRSEEDIERAAREGMAQAATEYLAYHNRHAAGEAPLDDWAKVVLVPGIGMVTAFRDKTSAITANLCYRAVLESIENAEAVDAFRFLSEADVFEVEHWPLERRKVEEAIAKELATKLLPRRVVAVIGGGSGIGQAAALRFAEAGAHVVVGDLDAVAAEQVAAEITSRFPHRAVGLPLDVRDDDSIAALLRRAVLEYGGLDCLFYTAGLAPRIAPVTSLTRADLLEQLAVHYLGAVVAIGAAGRILQRQGRGGSIVASVSKAAVSPGKNALGYGGSKAALLHALRVAAVELGAHGIRVNAVNADQVDTPLFRRFVSERARLRGVSVEEQLESYRRRNLMGVSLIPPDAVADLAVLLASDRFRYTTGDFLTVDGGLPDAFPR